MVQDPCFDPREFRKYVGQTTRLFCEFEHESSITVTSIMWSRQLLGGTIETFYSKGVFHTDKDFLHGASHLTTETVITATRFKSYPYKFEIKASSVQMYSENSVLDHLSSAGSSLIRPVLHSPNLFSH